MHPVKALSFGTTDKVRCSFPAEPTENFLINPRLQWIVQALCQRAGTKQKLICRMQSEAMLF